MPCKPVQNLGGSGTVRKTTKQNPFYIVLLLPTTSMYDGWASRFMIEYTSNYNVCAELIQSFNSQSPL